MMLNFSYGVIVAVGILVAISLGFIVMSPDDVIGDYVQTVDVVPDSEPQVTLETTTEPVDISPIISIPEGTSVPGCEVDDACYLPPALTIPSGTTVTWVVDDNAAHTVTSGSPNGGIADLFDSGLVIAGDEFEYTFEDAGYFEYFCIVHPWMVGTVTVT